MDREQFMDEATERYRKNLKIDMEYNRIRFLRKQARTPGNREDYLETMVLVYAFMTASFIAGILFGSGI
jgi:hypothetical protein